MQNDCSKSSVSRRTTSYPRPRLNSGVFSLLSRYPSDTDNQIYSNNETRIWNPILMVLIVRTASLHICLWVSPCVHQCFDRFHLIAPQENSNFRWSITGLILKALSVLSSFLLSAKCRFWKIWQKWFPIIVFWTPSLLIRLSLSTL